MSKKGACSKDDVRCRGWLDAKQSFTDQISAVARHNMSWCAGKHAAKHKVKVVSVAEVSEDEGLEEAEDWTHSNQMARWHRLADAATKQSLRSAIQARR